MQFGFDMALTLEEQACLLLWERLAPHIVIKTIGDEEEIRTAITEIIHRLAELVRKGN